MSHKAVSADKSKWRGVISKPALATLVAGLLLVAYICFLVISNYRSQMALQASSLNRYRLNLEKLASSLAYFVSERKYDLSAMVHSNQIRTYYVNKGLGMSEQYGLKVNLFMIEQLFRKTLSDKLIQGDKIYKRFVFLDRSGRKLVDTRGPDGDVPARLNAVLEGPWDEPRFHVRYDDGNLQVLVASSCRYKGKVAGKVIAWLRPETLFAHFVNTEEASGLSGSALMDNTGRLFCLSAKDASHQVSQLLSAQIARLPAGRFSFCRVPFQGQPIKLLVARLPIHNVDIHFVSWVPLTQIVGTTSPRRLVISMGSVAVIVLLGLGLVMGFTAQHLVLRTRLDEARRQHELMTAKNAQLEEAIRRRKAAEKELETQRTRRVRSDRLRSLGEMAAGMAHELNQPLVGIRGFAELIIDSLDHDLEMTGAELRSHLAKIVEQVDRMVHIINHVRLFARDAGSGEVSQVDLNEVVHSAVSLLEVQFNAHGLHLEKGLSGQAMPVRVNPFSIEEVILNLLSNARHAVESRRKSDGDDYRPIIRVTTRSVVAEDGSTKQVSLVVADNGTGIPKAVAHRVFDPFFTTKEPDQGTGLGLSICKSIVEEFSGQIEFISIENEGTRFEVRLPIFIS